ncbi:hypothetical protein N9A94_09405, partial [Akkermansiaceae bacterium]|nr:hypothetical protein [Akkermansiaceae bacterium]
LVPVKHFHIPGLILGADTQARKIKTITSQIDLPTTLLSLAGISAEHPMIGRDLSSEDPDLPGRAFMQFSENFCMMEDDKLVILQPEKPASFGRYDSKSKTVTLDAPEDPTMAHRALAHSLLPSWLYRNRLYR